MAKVTFRDETRDIPEYLADLMVGMDTYLMTYDQAVAEVNHKLERAKIDSAVNTLIDGHFKAYGIRR